MKTLFIPIILIFCSIIHAQNDSLTLQKRLGEDSLSTARPFHQSPITNHQSPNTNHQSPNTNHQSPITNHQSPITNHQSPITNHQSPITKVYRSPQNPHYWKNRIPYSSYWQQDVHYEIKATIDDMYDIIDANYKLTYWNNSPHDLNELYFHLYQNTFQPGSYYHNLWLNNKRVPRFGKRYEKDGLGTVIENLKVNGASVDTMLDNTILKIKLNQPLKSGDSLIVTMHFITYFDQGSMRRRMKRFYVYGQKHYNGVHWYPSICVYDKKFGWTTDQHLDKEFYSDFGNFDVELTFSQEYIVEATGVLQNREEVLPDTLREKLDIKNFKEKPLNSTPSKIISKEKNNKKNVGMEGDETNKKKAQYVKSPLLFSDLIKTKTWKYHAENVHNFAFTADPTYRIGETEWEGIKVIAIVQESHASRWQQSAEFAAKIIGVYSQDFGMYAWPKIVIADARSGMEYPMMILVGGLYPRHKSLLAHEIGHMWFYGMVGNNETYRAFLDEGFTQFLTVWCMNKLEAIRNDIPLKPEKDIKTQKKSSPKKHRKIVDHRYNRIYFSYLKNVIEGYDAKLNTHSSAFNGALRHGGGYGMVYYKGGIMLYNLKYVLGDELFLKAMQYYFNKWKFCHPYPEDFREAIIEYTQVDLNWFFDQWLETTKYIDYAIQKVKRSSSSSGSSSKEKKDQSYEIKFKRIGRMQMPIDFTVTTKKGSIYNYHIPNTWFIKKFPHTDSMLGAQKLLPADDSTATATSTDTSTATSTATSTDTSTATATATSQSVHVLPKWYGWDRLKPTYIAKITIDDKIKNVEIDPQHYLADVNLRNNTWKGISTLEFDRRKRVQSQWTTQQNYWRPDIWYNSYDGFQLGLHAEGNYFGKDLYSATVWYNSRLVQNKNIGEEIKKKNNIISVDMFFKGNLNKYWRNAWLTGYVNHNAGLFNSGVGLEKTFRKQDRYNPRSSKIYIKLKSMFREKNTDLQYLMYPEYWSTDSLNNTLDFGFQRNYRYQKGRGRFNINIRTPFIASDFNYSYIQVLSVNNNYMGKFELKTRFFAQYGFGAPPRESALYLAGANPEALYADKFTRAAGFIPADWVGYGEDANHFQYGGGLNLRGYAGYLAPVDAENQQTFNYLGKSGISANFELDFDRFINFKPKKLRKYFHLDTYLFSDLGLLTYKNMKGNEILGSFRMDAGIGSALTIKAGWLRIKPLTIRFDMPLFLNRTPAVSPEFIQFRYVVGINRAF